MTPFNIWFIGFALFVPLFYKSAWMSIERGDIYVSKFVPAEMSMHACAWVAIIMSAVWPITAPLGCAKLYRAFKAYFA